MFGACKYFFLPGCIPGSKECLSRRQVWSGLVGLPASPPHCPVSIHTMQHHSALSHSPAMPWQSPTASCCSSRRAWVGDRAHGGSNNPGSHKINLEQGPRPPPQFALPVTTFLVSSFVQLNSFPVLFCFVGQM